MKTFNALVVVLLTFVGLRDVRAAVTVQNITAAEFNTLTTSYTAAWSVVFTGGGMSGYASEEIRLARNTATPVIGGGSGTLIGNLTWSASNNDLEISIDSSGNLSARANSVSVGALPVIRPFNQILIFLHDESIFDSTSLTGTDINTFTVRNMAVDGFGSPGLNDVVSISGFGGQSPFTLNSVWNPGIAPVTDQQYVRVVAIQNIGLIPEPSSILLIGVTSLIILRRKR
jgi:hypothetical protein